MQLGDPVDRIKGVGPTMQEKLARLGIDTVGGLLMHFPRDYRSYGRPLAASDKSMDDDSPCAYLIRLTRPASIISRGRMQIVTTSVPAGGSNLQIIWYNMPYLKKRLTPGRNLILYGKIIHKGSRRILEHPDIFEENAYAQISDSLQPVYSLTQGITQNFMKKAAASILADLDLSSDHIPEDIRKRYQLAEYNFALRQIHFPENAAALAQARSRLAFDEFFLFILSVRLLSRDTAKAANHFKLREDVNADSFIASLPYKLTSAQMRAFRETDADMRSDHVMNRLIQGDVGSGKTIVAALALMEAALSGYQCCLMAPTDVLARQHFEKFSSIFSQMDIRVLLLTGAMKASEKREAYKKIQSHEADIIIGTHALFQEKVVYDRLGLIVTDEQHRFGVRQRQLLSAKSSGGQPHVLVMSATPIPRTLAIVLYSDLDISIIDEKPQGRIPIKNCLVDTSYRQAAYRLMEKEVKAGHQVYIICPLISESDGIEAENVEDYSSMLRKKLDGRIRVGLLHGRMKADEKDRVMKDFSEKKIDVLVSTTVIEVGVDVPSATVMMIENCERFGLAQLHQLRGRVGRGSCQSYCIFMYGHGGKNVSRRLQIMVGTNDGFEIAAQDMKLRGPGDLFGVKQSGELAFHIADIFRDSAELMNAGQAASELLANDPDLSLPEHALLRDRVKEEGSLIL